MKSHEFEHFEHVFARRNLHGYRVFRPSPSYYQTILEGYQSAGFDSQILCDFAENSPEEPASGHIEETDDSHDTRSAVSADSDGVITDLIREQILAIRESGKTNMFDIRTVQYLAYQYEYYELVIFIEDHRNKYIHFILTGQES